MPDFEHRSTDFNQNRSTVSPEHRSTTPTESTASCNAMRIMTQEEFAARNPHPPSPVFVNIDRQAGPAIDRQRETAIDRQPPAPIDRRAPLTYRVQMPKIDVTCLNALRPRPNPSVNPPETRSTHSDDAAEPMEVDKAPMGRTLRRRKRKVAKPLKRDTNEEEMESFQTRVFRIPLEKPFEEAYFTHRLWMFFRETRQTEEDIRRMFCEAREKMKNRITLKQKKSDHGKTSGSEGGAFQGVIHFCGFFSEKLKRNPTMVAHTRDNMHTEEYDEDYEEERAIEYRAILDEEDRFLHHSSWKRNAPSIDKTISTSIDTHPHQTSRQRASTEIAYYPLIDTGVDRVREGYYSIGCWADDHHHESYAVETAIHEPEAENLFMQQRNSPTHQQRVTSEIYNTAGGVDDRFRQKSRQNTRPSIDVDVPSSIDRRP
ncbi:hypothetical protein F2Q69_00006543 [Brassica cretica]|uniref:Uncharacterized protein n=1 Tax=Brassica cretica TaxID=69181 RepID=A0A8S9NW11_BRACR|nr:hypothetical protein F2Q69_00006543 [Brassica cretica]